MALAKGVTLGPYEILSHIGAGGMGDVWRARDRRIGRDVAIKVLPDAFAPGDDRVRRFEQEARAAGALSHPGLVTIFDVGAVDGSPYIVMELLEGKTLRETLGDETPAPLSLRRTIDYAVQIASALAVAHEKGIIHRDLKPENLFITADGRVKILDFGLAKLAQDSTDADSRRTARHLTATGMVVGTPGYMSPEQVGAKPLDTRTDIFSFGAVLYEMICGNRAFDRDTAVETMTAILNEDPVPLRTLAPDLPPAFDAIVHHCMEKNPRDRFQSARDLAFQIGLMGEYQPSRTDRTRAQSGIAQGRRRSYVAGTVILSLLALAGGGFAFLRRELSRPVVRRFKQLTFAEGLTMYPTLAPDGTVIAYVSSASGNRDIYVQRIDGRVPTNITSDSPADDSEPAFSPDGAHIAFRSERDGGGIFVMAVTGESVHRLTNFGHNPSWSPDGNRIVVSTVAIAMRPNFRSAGDGELWIIDAQSGATRPLVRARTGGPDFGVRSDAVQPSWSPHGKRIAFWGLSNDAGQREIWTIDPEAPRPKDTVVRVTSDASLHWNPVWSPDGKYLYFGSNADGTLNLWRIPMNENAGAPTGAAESVTVPASLSGNFAISKHGELVFTSLTHSYRLLALPFGVQRGSTEAPRTLFAGSQEIQSFEPSPDGRAVALILGGAQEDLFIVNTDDKRLRQLTNDTAKDREVTWSPDGKTLYFDSNRDGAFRIWRIRADGSGLTVIPHDSGQDRNAWQNVYLPRVSPDGRTIIVTGSRGSQALLHLDWPSSRRLELIGGDLRLDRWSPDGQQIVGTADGGVILYSPATHRSEKVLPHGEWPQWLPDGKKIVFFDRNRAGIFDLASRQVTPAPLAPAAGAQLDSRSILSRDGSTIYVRQTQEQGDIWMMAFQKQ